MKQFSDGFCSRKTTCGTQLQSNTTLSLRKNGTNTSRWLANTDTTSGRPSHFHFLMSSKLSYFHCEKKNVLYDQTVQLLHLSLIPISWCLMKLFYLTIQNNLYILVTFSFLEWSAFRNNIYQPHSDFIFLCDAFTKISIFQTQKSKVIHNNHLCSNYEIKTK